MTMFNASFTTILGFVLVIVIFFIMAVKSVTEWNRNNRNDVIRFKAVVIRKFHELPFIPRSGTEESKGRTASGTGYFVTFKDEHGELKEFRVKSKEYEQLSVGDRVLLSHQGTRFIGFEREI